MWRTCSASWMSTRRASCPQSRLGKPNFRPTPSGLPAALLAIVTAGEGGEHLAVGSVADRSHGHIAHGHQTDARVPTAKEVVRGTVAGAAGERAIHPVPHQPHEIHLPAEHHRAVAAIDR